MHCGSFDTEPIITVLRFFFELANTAVCVWNNESLNLISAILRYFYLDGSVKDGFDLAC